jgi:RNA polymerase sigma factor (TIGR02999 family)
LLTLAQNDYRSRQTGGNEPVNPCALPDSSGLNPRGFVIVSFVPPISKHALEPGSPDALAAQDLLPVVYQELRRLAAHKMASVAGDQTLQPTALVHEAWLRLAGDDTEVHFKSRTHFFSAAAEAMRHILIDRARRKQAARHGGGQQRVEADDQQIAAPAQDEELLAVNDALERLARLDPAKAELVKLRYFVGMTLEEAAVALGISEPTAKRRWALAKAWLFNEIQARA